MAHMLWGLKAEHAIAARRGAWRCAIAVRASQLAPGKKRDVPRSPVSVCLCAEPKGLGRTTMAGGRQGKGLGSSGGSARNPKRARTAAPPSERVPAAWLHLTHLGTGLRGRCKGLPALGHSARYPACPPLVPPPPPGQALFASTLCAACLQATYRGPLTFACSRTAATLMRSAMATAGWARRWQRCGPVARLGCDSMVCIAIAHAAYHAPLMSLSALQHADSLGAVGACAVHGNRSQLLHAGCPPADHRRNATSAALTHLPPCPLPPSPRPTPNTGCCEAAVRLPPPGPAGGKERCAAAAVRPRRRQGCRQPPHAVALAPPGSGGTLCRLLGR